MLNICLGKSFGIFLMGAPATLPVAAIPMMSLRRMPSGQQYAWICEGPGKPASLRAALTL